MSPFSATLAPPPSSMPDALPTQLQRRLAIVLAVVLFHVGALWALQSGLLKRAVELVIPVQVLAEFVEPPQPQIEPPPPAPQAAPIAPAFPLAPSAVRAECRQTPNDPRTGVHHAVPSRNG